MPADTLGKKTHLPAVLHLFWNADRIWNPKLSYNQTDAINILQQCTKVASTFVKKSWPWDVRSQQAYVHRFFRWLELPPNMQRLYPTRLLAASDSVALRQCLWLDFVFGTPEAQRALRGLHGLLSSRAGPYELSAQNQADFCAWLGVGSDNTRRGPLARWMEDVGLAIPLPNRGAHETAVVVELSGSRYSTPEALAYGLLVEGLGELTPSDLTARLLPLSWVLQDALTPAALFIKKEDILAALTAAEQGGYLEVLGGNVRLDVNKMARALASHLPFPDQAWLDATRSIESPLDQTMIDRLAEFPVDDVTALSGTVFLSEQDLTTGTQTKLLRDASFARRVSSAYNHQCAVTGRRFRSPLGSAWYGDAAHIVPHSGKARDGTKVYGSSVVTNGIHLGKFEHWCFDRGWITLLPEVVQGSIQGYRLHIATACVDDFFAPEAEVLSAWDGMEIDLENLPADIGKWPSVEALQWHADNVFDG